MLSVRKLGGDGLRQVGKFRRIIMLLIIANVVATSAVVVVWQSHGINPHWLYRDPNAVARQPFYMGLLSNIGAIGWISAAAVTAFAFVAKCKIFEDRTDRSILYVAVISALFGLDDLLMLHDGLFPAIGLPGAAMYLAYLVLCLLWFLQHYRDIFAGPWLLAFIGFGCLGLSLVFDVVGDHLWHFPGMIAVEDAFKLLGISFWCAYSAAAALDVLRAGRVFSN